MIVPVYNGRDYLRDCIDSIENQTCSHLEIIIVDDGSTDGTGKLCLELQKEYSNLQILRLEDQGVSAARNAGLQKASGAYLTFVDADDRIGPNMLETLLHTLESTDSDVAGCSFQAWKNQEEWEHFLAVEKETLQSNQLKTYDGRAYLEKEILSGNSRCWSKLYKRSLLNGLGFREGLTIGEDMLFLVDLMPKVHKVVEISYAGYGYFQNAQGAMYREFRPAYMDQIRCWEIAREQIGKAAPELNPKVTTLLLTGIMLTVGKLAVLSKKERRENRQYVSACHEKLLEELQKKGREFGKSDILCQMPKSYQLKIKLFADAPQLYLWLYHFKKYI